MRTRHVEPPVEGAVRVYRVVPSGPEAVELAKRAFRARGWEPLDDDVEALERGPYTSVALWATPPRR